MIFHRFSYPLDKLIEQIVLEVLTKIKLSCCLLSTVFGNCFWKDFGVGMEAFLGPNSLSKATSKASAIKYATQQGSGAIACPPPHRNFPF